MTDFYGMPFKFLLTEFLIRKSKLNIQIKFCQGEEQQFSKRSISSISLLFTVDQITYELNIFHFDI